MDKGTKSKTRRAPPRKQRSAPPDVPLEAVELMEEFLALPESMREAVEQVVGGAASIDAYLQRNGRDSKKLYKFIARLLVVLIDDETF